MTAAAHIITTRADLGVPRIMIMSRGTDEVLDRIPLTPGATIASGEFFLRTYTPWRVQGEPTDPTPGYRIWALHEL